LTGCTEIDKYIESLRCDTTGRILDMPIFILYSQENINVY